MKRKTDLSENVDWTTILFFATLVILGWLNIFAAIYDETANQVIWNLSLSSGRQLLFIAASVVIAATIIIVNRQFYETFAYVFYGLIVLLLFLVPFIGKEVGGNIAWIGVGSFGIQPSEFAKFITALAIAKFIGSINFRMDNLKNQAILFVLIGIPIVLIQMQKDTGTALIFTSFVLVLYREGMSPFLMIIGLCAIAIFILTLLTPNPLYLHAAILVILILSILFGKKKFRHIVTLIVGALIISGVIESVDYIVNNVLKPHQQNRIKVLINPDIDPLGAGWNVTQSKIAIGSGGLSGKGFLKGTQTKFDFVPKQSTDFIFCTIGEEFGWIGSAVIISLFIGLLLRVIFLAERQRSRFARAYGYSVASILFFHFAINIGMTVGLLPVIGIPLPFFSYGGSALLSFTILLFILIKLDAHRSQVLQRN